MTIRVTITKPGVTDAYGIAMVVGTTYTVDDPFGLSLISQGRASDTDSVQTSPGLNLGVPISVVYVNAAAIAAPTAQMIASYNVQFALDTAPFTRFRSNGTTLVPLPTWSDNTSSQGLIGANGAILSLSEVTDYVNLTATGTAFTGACEFAGYVCTVAAGNITVYDNTSAAGTVIVPTTALAVGAFPIFGAGTNGKMALTTGCHVVLSGAATVNVLVG